VAEAIVAGEIGDDEAAQVERSDRALILVDDFALGAEEHGEGDRGIPAGVELFNAVT
jgi:hypothetical protein